MADESPAEHLGRAIHLRRVELGLKRRDLAIASNLSYPYVSEIENGHKEPSAKALRQLAEALKLTPVELVALTERVGGTDAGSLLLEQEPTKQAHVEAAARPLAFIAAAPPTEVAPSEVVPRSAEDHVRRIVQIELAEWLEHRLPLIVRDAVRAELHRHKP